MNEKKLTYINTENLLLLSSFTKHVRPWKEIDEIPIQVYTSLICGDFSVLTEDKIYSPNDYPRKHMIGHNKLTTQVIYPIKNRTKVILQDITILQSNLIILKMNRLNVALGVINEATKLYPNF